MSTKRAPIKEPSATPLPRWFVVTVAALLLILFASLSFWEMAGDSLTSDEQVHLPAGYAYWKQREFRLNPEHPPLVKLLASAPLLAMNLKMPPTRPESLDGHANEFWAFNNHQWVFGDEFLFTQDADRIIFWGRLPVVALGVWLAFFVFLWSWKFHGSPGAGLLSLFLIALEPTILAHSHYVTTDVVAASFGIMAMFFLWLFSREGRFPWLAFASLGLGLALAAKFSALFFVPIFFFLLFAYWPTRKTSFIPFLSQDHPWKTRLAAGATVALLAAVIVQASYLFALDPFLYINGMRTVNANHIPNYLYYLNGSFFAGGVWWYPLYAFLLKTPLPTMIAIVITGIFYAINRERRPEGLAFLLLPAAVLTFVICALVDNLGVRYMIPVTAFLLVFAGGAYRTFSGSRKATVVAAVLGVWLAVSVLRVSPHYISYFNELIGGPENAPYYLDDSNVDWGQDVKRLIQYFRNHRIEEASVAVWGPTPPKFYADRYGLRLIPIDIDERDFMNPPPGVYAISVNNLVHARRLNFRLFYGLEQKLDWLRRFKPSHRVGYSIYIYRFPESGRNP